MIIKVAFYPEAKDRMDAEEAKPLYHIFATNFDDAVDFVGKIHRIETAKEEKAALDQELKDTIPF